MMLPSWVPPVPVLTTTLAPPVSASTIRFTPSFASSPVDSNGLLPLMLVVVSSTSTISMLYGSSSQVPPAPAGAATSAAVPMVRSPWLEVSTMPPLPPATPPRADSWPAETVLRSDHTTTEPPLPRFVASARTVAPASM